MAKGLSKLVLSYFERLAGGCFPSVFLEELPGAENSKYGPQHSRDNTSYSSLWKGCEKLAVTVEQNPVICPLSSLLVSKKLVGVISVVQTGRNQTLGVWVSVRQGCAVDVSLDQCSEALGIYLTYNLWQVP